MITKGTVTICTCIRGKDVRVIVVPDPNCDNVNHRSMT